MSEPVSAGLSVIIPSYNAGPWLPATLSAVDAAIRAAGLDAAEIVVVDDGSTDDTEAVVTDTAGQIETPTQVIRTSNQGRFLARWTGVAQARYAETLLLDARVLVAEDGLRHVLRTRAQGDGQGPWNAHVDTAANTALVGLFWEVPTYVFWGEYRARPRPLLITPENFDRVPKGTGCFLVPTALFVEACRACWPEKNSHLVSDDTMLLRYIASRAAIRLDPGFRGDYEPRQRLRSFLSHSFTRGTLFVSSYGGTSRARDAALAGLCAAPVVGLGALAWAAAAGRLLPVTVAALALLLVAAGAPAAVAALRRCPARAIAAFFVFLVPFGVVFWAGLCRGLVVHRAQLRGPRRRPADAA